MPKAAIGPAMTECWGVDWFDEGPGGFADAERGQYHYNIVAMLDALKRALADQRPA
ncbi:hypothetical protein ACFWGI_07840 [Streptomyces niveus]|uniref:hypothetical protein n=1 Tax=Streptomyces niveus TaxID=193462 RepID=UPI00364E8423